MKFYDFDNKCILLLNAVSLETLCQPRSPHLVNSTFYISKFAFNMTINNENSTLLFYIAHIYNNFIKKQISRHLNVNNLKVIKRSEIQFKSKYQLPKF